MSKGSPCCTVACIGSYAKPVCGVRFDRASNTTISIFRVVVVLRKVNAIVAMRDSDALMAEARAAELDAMAASGAFAGPLHGLPVAIKDCFETKGLRTTWGSRSFEAHVPGYDAHHVARLRAAGAVITGKSNTPEFTFSGQTSNLLAGTTLGLLALLSGIPAAPLAGALLGAGIVSMSGRLDQAVWPTGTRTVLEIGIGTVIGTGLTRASLEQLQVLWRPALLITVTLVLTGIVIGLWSSRLLGIDPVVALLGAAPGGISGMSLVGAEFGVGAAVAALHAVRLITVLLVLPLVVRLVLPSSLGQP